MRLVKWPRASAAGILFAVSLLGLSLALWFLSFEAVGDFQVDDAYITFAFSKNLASGNGPIYGHDLRVEGYSNFLWMVLVAAGMLFSANALAIARLLAHLASAALLYATYRGARQLSGPIPSALSVVALAACSDLTRAAQSGLETCLYAAFVAASLTSYLEESPQKRRWSMIWAALAALTRIDGFVPLLVLAGLEGIRRISHSRRLDAYFWRWLGLGAAPVIAYWLGRYAYYGLPLPLPFYAKASQTIAGASSGAQYVLSGIRDLGLWLPLLCVALGFPRPLDRRAMVLLGFVAIGGAYVVYVGGDWMPMNRMLLPLLAPLFMLSSLGLEVLWAKLSRGAFASAVGRGIALLLTFQTASYMSQLKLETPEEKGKIAHAQGLSEHTHRLLEALPYIQAMMRKPGERLVTDYGGVFAFGTEASVIEMWGLCNRDIALKGNSEGINPIYGKTCVACYKDFDPEYFHSVVPLLRPDGAIDSLNQALRETFQGHAIDRVIGIRKRFRLGKVHSERNGTTLFFLEKKRPGLPYTPRKVGDFTVSYPSGS